MICESKCFSHGHVWLPGQRPEIRERILLNFWLNRAVCNVISVQNSCIRST